MAWACPIKARYWYLRKLELGGVPTARAVDLVRSFTQERCEELVNSVDNTGPNGDGPRYLRSVKTTNSPLPELAR